MSLTGLQRVSIRVKLAVLICAVIALVVLGQTVQSLVHESVAVHDQVALRARLVLVSLAGALSGLWTQDHVPDLTPFAERMQPRFDVKSLALVSPEGEVLALWGKPLSDKEIHRTVRLRLAAPLDSLWHQSFSDLPMLLATPVFRGTELRGHLLLGFVTREPKKRLQDLLWSALSTALLWMVCGGGLTLWLTGRITRPLVQLANSLEGLGQRDYAVPDGGHADGEIGVVQDKLVTLSQSLAAEREHVSTLTDALRHQVEVVTGGLERVLEQQHAILDASRDAILLCRADGTVLQANRAAVDFFGEAVDGGSRVQAAVVEQQSLDEAIARAAQSGSTSQLHVHTRGPQSLYLRLRLTRCAVAADAPHGLLVVAEDTSESERLLVQMLRSERLASLGALTAGLAHQIGNQLNAIGGYAELISRRYKGGEPQTTADLTAITKQVRSARELLNRVLLLARTRPRASVPFEVTAAVREAWAMARLQADRQKVQLADELLTPSCIASGDPQLLAHAFFNLIMNAIQAMPQGGTVTLRSWCENDICKVHVADVGIGIADQNLAHIFEPFFTTKDGNSDAGGTGLGLAIAARIFEMHQGSVRVLQSSSDGTTFEVIIQRSFPTVDDAASAQDCTACVIRPPGDPSRA